MKKIILIILICGTMVLNVTGCNSFTEKETKIKKIDDIHSFEGTIIECDEKFMIVRPNKNEEEYKSSDKFKIEYAKEFNSCNVNDKVKITYKGMVDTSYPAQIGTIKIEIVSEK